MFKESICSLCIVVEVKSGGFRLFRVADTTASNILTPYVMDSTQEMSDYNRDHIYFDSQFPAVGTSALWNWSSTNNFQKTTLEKRQNWVEYIQFEGVNDFDSLKRKLLAGIAGIDSSHDYLFEYERLDNGQCNCVFLQGKDLVAQGEKPIEVKDNIFFLNTVTINLADVFDMTTWRIPDFRKKYYKHLSPIVTDRKELFRPAEAIVKQILLTRINKYTANANINKSGKAIVRNFLSSIAGSTLLEDIAVACSCDEDIAKDLLATFMEKCEDLILCDDFEAQLMLRLIDSDKDISIKFKELVETEWKQENSSLINEEHQKLSDLLHQVSVTNKQLDELKATHAELSQSKSELEKQISNLKLEHEHLLSISADIAGRVRKNISSAEKDLAAFFSDHAMFTLRSNPVTTALNSSPIINGKRINDSPERLKGLSDVMECLEENLESIGVPKGKASSLAAYLWAAYTTRTSLVLAGYGAASFLNALSATLLNKTVHRLVKTQSVSLDALYSIPTAEIVIVDDALQNGELVRMLSASNLPYICASALTAEELAIEPRGIFNYALPLFTEFFLESSSESELEGWVSNVRPEVKRKAKGLILPGDSLPMLAVNRCHEVLGTAMGIGSIQISTYDTFVLQTIPIMLSLDKKTELLTLIANSSCSDKEKQSLCTMVGGQYD